MGTKYSGESMLLAVDLTGTAGAYTTIGGSSDHTMSINNENVDTTDKDSSRWGESKPFGKRSVSVSMNGFVSDDTQFQGFAAKAETDTNVDCQLSYGTKTATGEFHIESLEYTGANNGAQQFSCSLQSDGVITFA